VLLKKMGLGEDASKDHHLTPSGTNMGGWPPYPLGPFGWPGLFLPYHYGPAASRAQLMPGTWKEGHGLEGQWAGFRLEPEGITATEGPGPSTKRPRLEEDEEDTISLLDDSEALELIEFDPQVKPTGSWDPPTAIRTFLEKHFNKVLSEEEREAIMDFPKPNFAAVVIPRLTGDTVQQLKSNGKNPHLVQRRPCTAHRNSC